ncbi:hypothetical protein RS130_13575 [Paraglaciecola aquimarina]|uniref:Uncharacterized protein n=1 Tax=Paraglaciecola aquimarina TaxID=1235557 RepID=A0ABU3SXR5_9ALTE|nr:hypothetical protein [Paraglaciecola aquimarina]MDU0354810.1 hypothetical protein [Paraglaciecola aquimarina]
MNEKSDILGERVLGHPHVDEQPFTRSLKNVVIPMSSQTVFIEARDSKHGWAENRLEVNLDKAIAGLLVIKPE